MTTVQSNPTFEHNQNATQSIINEEPMFNAIISNRWKLVSLLGQGGFGFIYKAENLQSQHSNQQIAAVKMEKLRCKRPLLKQEMLVIRALHAIKSKHVISFIECGKFEGRNYFVMHLVSHSVSDLRRICRGDFTLTAALFLSNQMLECIHQLHQVGFLHRDIKPSNFAIGFKPNHRTVYVFDFGLCRQYCNRRGKVRAPRETAGFRGTVRYSSLSGLQMKELGPRDDIESLFYLFVELFSGYLPWRKGPIPRAVMADVKNLTTKNQLFAGLKLPALEAMYDYIKLMKYDEIPDYQHLTYLLSTIADDHNIDIASSDLVLDWDCVIGENEDKIGIDLDVKMQFHNPLFSNANCEDKQQVHQQPNVAQYYSSQSNFQATVGQLLTNNNQQQNNLNTFQPNNNQIGQQTTEIVNPYQCDNQQYADETRNTNINQNVNSYCGPTFLI